MNDTKKQILLYSLIAVLIILSIIFVYLAAIDGADFSGCAECRAESTTKLMITVYTVFLIPNFFLLLYVFVLRIFRWSRHIVSVLLGLFSLLILRLFVSNVANLFANLVFEAYDAFSLIYLLALFVLFASGAINFMKLFAYKRFLVISSGAILVMHTAFIIYNIVDCAKHLLPFSAFSAFTYCSQIFLSIGTALFSLAILLLGLHTNSLAKCAPPEESIEQ